MNNLSTRLNRLENVIPLRSDKKLFSMFFIKKKNETIDAALERVNNRSGEKIRSSAVEKLYHSPHKLSNGNSIYFPKGLTLERWIKMREEGK